VEADIPADPVAITALCAYRVMLQAKDLPDLIHEFKVGIGENGFDKRAAGGKVLKM
jgi:hypothetical protein